LKEQKILNAIYMWYKHLKISLLYYYRNIIINYYRYCITPYVNDCLIQLLAAKNQ